MAAGSNESGADGLTVDAMRFALCSLVFFVCVNQRESAVRFLKNWKEDALRHALCTVSQYSELNTFH